MYPEARRYILDSNGRGDFAEWTGRVVSDAAPPPLARRGMQQVWTPGLDSRREYDTWLGGILNAKESAIVFIDELAALVAEHKAPDNFERIIKLGRVVDLKRDKRISIIICTQEQAYMPRQALNQATHIVRFRLQSEYDARAVERAVGMRTEIAQPSTRWGFFHIRADNPGEYHEYSSPEEFFGKRVA